MPLVPKFRTNDLTPEQHASMSAEYQLMREIEEARILKQKKMESVRKEICEFMRQAFRGELTDYQKSQIRMDAAKWLWERTEGDE